MKVHSDTLTELDLHRAIADAPIFDVTLAKCTPVGSRKRKRAFDVALRGHGHRHTRAPNTGIYGAGSGYERAASFADWGFWIAEVYRLDPRAVVGPYTSADNFDALTKGAYRAHKSAEVSR